MKPVTGARPAHYRRIVAILLALVVAGGAVSLAPSVVAVAVAVALGMLLAFGAAVGMIALGVKRFVANTVKAHPHLSRIGRRFERDFTDVRVMGVAEEPGSLRLDLTWDGEHTVELDADGHPDTSVSAGGGSLTWVLPTQPMTTEERDLLLDLPGTKIQLVEEGAVMLNGPVVTARALTAANGVVIQATAPLPAL